MTSAPPKVFISYSHDTVEHQKRVLGLANRLRADGVDAEVDQYNAAPPEGWPLWCERQIAAADVVLMVCTETYHCRVSGDKGLGAVWEARIIRQLLYDAGAVGDKFVPVLFSDASPDQIPTPIKGGTRYVVDTEGGYEELYRRLTGQPRLLRPALGIRALPTRRRQWPEGTMKAASSSPNLRATQETGERMEPVSGNQEADMGEKMGEGQSGGVNIAGTVDPVAGNIVGGNKIIYEGATADEIVSRLVAVLDERGATQKAENAGLERRTIIKLAQRLNPDELLDFDQAIIELESAVNVALDVIAQGERGTNLDAFIDAVLAHVAEKTRAGDFDGGASTIDQSLAELDAKYRRSRVALLEEGVKVDILRRDAFAVARRIETLVAVDQPTERPAWLPAFRERYDTFYADGEAKGTNFSLSVAIELARRMLATATAHDSTERGTAAILLGNALRTLGERESGTERLQEAVDAYGAALQEWTRERVPLQWAGTQNNLGTALGTLGARTHDGGQLKEARKAISDAFNVFMQAGQQQYRSYFEDRLHEIDRQISALKTAR